MALCIKRNDTLYIYETLSKDGCKLRHWKDFLMYSWNLLYEKIVYRQLNINIQGNVDDRANQRKVEKFYDEIDNKIFEFVKITEGKPYRLTCNKLFCFGTPKQYEIKNDWGQCKGFYCSSLVAAALMFAGIIKINSGPGKYKPGIFSSKYDKSKLCINDEFDYGAEYIVDFSS